MKNTITKPRTSLWIACLALLLLPRPAGAEIGVVHQEHFQSSYVGPYELHSIIDDGDPVNAWRIVSAPGESRIILNPDGEANRDGRPFAVRNLISGLPMVTWGRRTEHGYDVVLSWFENGAWTTPVVLAAQVTVLEEVEPVLVVDPADGSVHLLYWQDDVWSTVMHRQAPADLSDWSPPTPVSTASELALRPSGAFFGGLLHVVYENHAGQMGGTPRQIVLAVENGSGFSGEVVATTPHGDPNWPAVHASINRIWIDWVDADGAMGWTRREGAGAWDPVQTEPFGSVAERKFKVRQTIRGLALD